MIAPKSLTLILAAGENNFSRNQERLTSKYDFDIDGIDLIARVISTFHLGNTQLVVSAGAQNRYQKFDDIRVIGIRPTKGALISALIGLKGCDLSLPLFITPGDSLITPQKYIDFINHCEYSASDISLIVFNSNRSDYSYIRNVNGKLVEVCEKKVISSQATAGIFFFRTAQLFVECAEWAIMNNLRTEGSFFLAPALNYAVVIGLTPSLFKIQESDYYRFSTLTEAIESEIRYKNAN